MLIKKEAVILFQSFLWLFARTQMWDKFLWACSGQQNHQSPKKSMDHQGEWESGVWTCHSGNTIRKAFCVVRTEWQASGQILFCILLFSYNQTFCILETFGSVSRVSSPPPHPPFLLTFLFFLPFWPCLLSYYLVFLARHGTHYSTPPI